MISYHSMNLLLLLNFSAPTVKFEKWYCNLKAHIIDSMIDLVHFTDVCNVLYIPILEVCK